jgi:nifR3 family TIM-barrel protein
MGCGVPKVTKLGAGAAMMRDLDLVREVFRAVRAATPLPVSVKMRACWTPDGPTALDVARVAEEEGLVAVTVHPRPGKVHHNVGRADWRIIREVKEELSIPVIGNGDVRSAEDAMRMLETTGCDAVMLGRAAFGDPWIFRRLRAFHERGETLPLPTPAERLQAGLRHLDLMIRYVGPAIASREMRKHVAWYVKGLPRSHRVRESINHTRTVEEMADLLRSYLEELEQLGDGPFDETAAPATGTAGTAEGDSERPVVAAG